MNFQNEIDYVKEMQKQARFYKWQLEKWGYCVNIISHFDSEIFDIWEDNKKLFNKNLSFGLLHHFYELIKKNQHKYGTKRLHEHTLEVLEIIKSSFWYNDD